MAASELAARKKALSELVSCELAFDISWYAALLFLVLGVVAEVAKINLGLAATSWFLLVIAALLAAVSFRLGTLLGWYLRTTK